MAKQSGTVNHSGKKELPSTGAKQDLWAFIGLALLALADAFRKENRHDTD